MRAHTGDTSPSNDSNDFAPPICEILTTETGLVDITDRNLMIQPQMIQFHTMPSLPTDLPLQGDRGEVQIELDFDDNDDKPPEIKRVYFDKNDTHKYNDANKNQPDQSSSPKKQNRLQKRLSSRELRKQRTFFFGIFSKRHGVCVNLLRLLFAIVTIPFLLIAVVFTMVIITTKKIFCKVGNEGVSCCSICTCQTDAIETCWDVVQCNCQSAALDCDKKYEVLLKIRDKRIESCVLMFTKGGESCGDCFESLIDKLIGMCIEQCHNCGCFTCRCCSQCEVDLSGCGTCAGECTGGLIRDTIKCCGKFWGCFCERNICEVLTGACDGSTKGILCSCLDLLGAS